MRIPDYIGIFGFILWALIERWFHLSGQKQTGGKGKDQGTYWLISACWYGAILTAFLDTNYTFWTPQGAAVEIMRWCGIPLVMLGLVVRYLARKALGRQYSVVVETSEAHQLVTVGIYRVLRHPAYAGLLCLIVGIPMCLGSLVGLGIALVGGFPAVLYRIKIEEATLANRFGVAYRTYSQGTWRILPWVW